MGMGGTGLGQRKNLPHGGFENPILKALQDGIQGSEPAASPFPTWQELNMFRPKSPRSPSAALSMSLRCMQELKEGARNRAFLAAHTRDETP